MVADASGILLPEPCHLMGRFYLKTWEIVSANKLCLGNLRYETIYAIAIEGLRYDQVG